MSGHTPGPWQWFGNLKAHDIYLATKSGGRLFVLNFARWGMSGAQPQFQGHNGLMIKASDLAVREVDYRADIVDIDHPDARLIAASPALLEALKGAREFLMSRYSIYVGNTEDGKATLDAIEAAIRSAEGTP